jgi:6-phosphofructokinase
VKPDAIANGEPLRALLKVTKEAELEALHPRLELKDNSDTAKKLREAIAIAIPLSNLNKESLANSHPEHAKAAEATHKRLLELQDSLSKMVWLYNAVVKGAEDYSLGFSFQKYTGLSVELVNYLYDISPELLAQYIYRECVPEKDVTLKMIKSDDRDAHRTIYTEIQSAIFGKEDVDRLKKALRGYLDRAIWPDPKRLPPEKRVVMLISGGESPGVNDYFALAARRYARQGYSVEVLKFGLDGFKAETPEEFAKRRVPVTADMADNIEGMPGACEGTARINLDKEIMTKAVAYLKGYCKTVVMIGGNDHLKQASDLAWALTAAGSDIVVVGLPKTIDRDTKVYPVGAHSAGKYFRDSVIRAAPLPGSKKIAVVQAMGRDCGALAYMGGYMNDTEGCTPEQIRKMRRIDPTVIVAAPEWSVGENNVVVTSFADLINAVKVRWDKYGAVTVVMSEGFRTACRKTEDGRIVSDDSVLNEVCKNPYFRSRFESVKTDKLGNILFGEIDIGDFLVEAISWIMGLERDEQLFYENSGYSYRARPPEETDAVVADKATLLLVEYTTDPSKRKEILNDVGKCIAAGVSLKGVKDAELKVMRLQDALGTVDVKALGIGAETPQTSNIIGVIRPLDRLAEISEEGESLLPSLSRDEELAIKTDVAETMIASQGESAWDMNRTNICAITNKDADEIIERLKKRVKTGSSPSKANRYIWERTAQATLFIPSSAITSLRDIVAFIYSANRSYKMCNIIVSGNLKINECDSLLGELKTLRKKDERGNDAPDDSVRTLIDAAARDEEHNYLFGSELPNLIRLALTKTTPTLKSVLDTLGFPTEEGKRMSGIRTNIVGESLNPLPGERAGRNGGSAAATAESGVKEVPPAETREQEIDTLGRIIAGMEARLTTTASVEERQHLTAQLKEAREELEVLVREESHAGRGESARTTAADALTADELFKAVSDGMPLRAQRFVENIFRSLTERRDKASDREKTIVLGIDTDIGQNYQNSALAATLYPAIRRLKALKDEKTGKELFPNLMVVIKAGAALEEELVGLKNAGEIDLANTFAVVREANLAVGVFDKIKNAAWITAINDTNAKDGTYLPIFEALTLSMMAASDADAEAIKELYNEIAAEEKSAEDIRTMIGEKIIRLLPKDMNRFDNRKVKNLYDLAAREIHAAA